MPSTRDGNGMNLLELIVGERLLYVAKQRVIAGSTLSN